VRARLLVMGAGTGASNNLLRSLRAGDPELFIVGCQPDRFVLKKSPADRNYLVPASSQPDLLDALCRVIEAERIDLLVPNNDADARAVSLLRDKLPCRTFLPAHEAIERCQDKYDLGVLLRSRGVDAPLTHPISDLGDLEDVWGRLPPASRLWCRIRNGNSSAGALPVKTPEQARAWIRYWEEMRGVPARLFTLSEYLPGRDFNLQCLWHEGTPVLVKMCERLSYFVTGNVPSGVSSTPAVARTVLDRRVVDVCLRAIRVVDDRATGLFNVDVKENAHGAPCVTEINAGRFAMITNIYDLTGRHNMASAYVRLAMGGTADRLPADEVIDVVEDHYLVRDLDTTPGIFHADAFFDGVHDARALLSTS
jgi:hypothetical protein